MGNYVYSGSSILFTALLSSAALAQPAPAPAAPAQAGKPAPAAAAPAAKPAASDPATPPATPAPAPAPEAAAPAAPAEAPPPAATPPAPEATAAAAAPAAVPEKKAEEPNPLVPEGEKEKMASHPVDAAAVEFKPGKGLVVKSQDGDFELATRLRTQWLYTMSSDHKVDTTTQSLEIRRLRLLFAGNAFGAHNKFSLEFGLAPREVGTKNGTLTTGPILDAFAEFDYLRDLTLRVGQYKVPFGRQRVMSEGNLQFVDVSSVTDEFTFERDVGLDFRSKDLLGAGLFKYVLGVYTGQGRNSFDASKFNMLYLARVEVLPLGLFEDYQEADFDRTKPRLAIGGSLGYLKNGKFDKGDRGDVPADNGTTNFTVASGDAMFKAFGASVSTELFYRKGTRDAGPLLGQPDPKDPTATIGLTPSRDGVGWYGQAGYLLPAMPLEIAARYGIIRRNEDAQHDKLSDLNEVGGAVDYYFARHCLKLQLDYFRFWESGKMSDGKDQIRLQLQMAL